MNITAKTSATSCAQSRNYVYVTIKHVLSTVSLETLALGQNVTHALKNK